MDALRGSVGLRLSNTFFSFFLVLKTRVVSYETCFGNHSNTAFLICSYGFLSRASHCQICVSRLCACAESFVSCTPAVAVAAAFLAMLWPLGQLMEKKDSPQTGFCLVPVLECGTEDSLLLLVFIQSFHISLGKRKEGRAKIGV